MAEEKSTVFVELYDLSITERSDDRFGKVVVPRSISEDDLINMVVNRRTDFNPTTLKAVLGLFKDVTTECVLRGDSVKFGLGYFRLDVKGTFYGDNASWDSKKHRLSVNITPTGELREAVNSTNVKVRGMASTGTFINTVTDVATGEVNVVLTEKGGVNVTGSKIKIAGDNPVNGLYLVHEETSSETLVPMTSMLTNDPSKISFIMPPDLAPGDYKLKIVTQFSSGSTTLKEPRSYVSEYPLALLFLPS